MTPSPLEAELRRRFAVRTEEFVHGGFRVEVVLPAAADELIDEAEFEADERLPYWADLWPSARALARRVLDGPLPRGRTLELGCGVALPSLALLARGAEVLATDYYEDALLFARANAERNGLGGLPVRLLDWRDPPRELGCFGAVLAADVLYEQRNAELLAALLSRVVAPGGRVVVADPGRAYRSVFEERMREEGWTVEEERVREPTEYAPSGSQEIRLLHLRPPAT
ncbi:MAG TPA: methyltransferase domain-containing protein [Longimicrobiaceae bacterium]|nr:methyltransferase domain-containing protein [Longimicrobiaceae bacterium]